jgi:leucyl aminopeptidase
MKINVSLKSASQPKVDVLIQGYFEGKNIPSDIKKNFKGASHEAILASGTKNAVYTWAVGLGKEDKYNLEKLRQLASRIDKKAKIEKWHKLRIDFGSVCVKPDAASAQAVTEGLLLTNYRFDEYKSKKSKSKHTVVMVDLSVSKASSKNEVAKAVREGEIIAEGVNFARTLGNQPSNELYPESYAKRIQKMAREFKIRCTVFDDKKLAIMKMGAILAVGRGSARKPRLVVLEYKPARRKNSKPIVLVGKGITFDTGGISIKPSKAMEEMKFDMCGSAAVVGTLRTAAKLKLPLHIIGITPLAENMPGGNAIKPGDIVRAYNGKTIEINNTDAEGRLVLADALAYSEKFKPKCVVDAATLTGACAYVLDYCASGVMTNNRDVVRRLVESGKASGERLWEFPMWDEYGEMIKATYADIQNVSKRSAGIQTAGWFLKHFADHSPWAHVDIAGTAWTTTPRDYHPAGATGVGVRLFTEFLKSYI